MENRKDELTIGEVISKAFILCKENWLELIKLIAVFVIPIIVLTSIIIGNIVGLSMKVRFSNNSQSLLGVFSMLIGIITLSIIIALISIYAETSIIRLIDDASNNREVSWKNALRHVWERKWSILGLNILILLITIGISIVLVLIIMLLALITLGIGLIVLVPLLLVSFICLSPLTILINSMFITRELSITESLGETVRLFKKGYFWNTLGRVSAIGGIMSLAGIVLTIVQIIPIIGTVVMIIGQMIIQVYSISACNLIIYSRKNAENNNAYIDPIL